MNEPQVDVLARRLANTGSRRGIVRSLAGLLLSGSALTRVPGVSTAQVLECNSGWETYCTETTGAEQCIDFSNDSGNCGICRNVCPDGTRCVDRLCNGSEAGRAPAGMLSASAQCVDGPRTWPNDELLEVGITNNTGRPVTLVHVSSMTGPDQPTFGGIEIPEGTAWQGLFSREVPDGIATHGAVVTTDAGALRLPCGYTDIPFSAQPVAGDDLEGSAAIMARTLSILEASGTALDALFALLHPDVRELVSFNQVICWYIGYVRAERPAGEATVTGVRIGPWTWDGNRVEYAEAAEVSYRQPFYSGDPVENGPPPTEEREATIHLVQADGIWRWFFGPDPEWLSQLPETC